MSASHNGLNDNDEHQDENEDDVSLRELQESFSNTRTTIKKKRELINKIG